MNVYMRICYVGKLTTKSNPLSDEDKEEVVTNTLANQLHIVLRDNPWFLKFIQESISKTKIRRNKMDNYEKIQTR